jgi:hypothetical protein
MRAKSFILCVLLALPLLSSCVKEGFGAASGDPVLTLSLDPGKMGITKASEYGSDELNENEIKSFRLYFYTSTADENTDAVYVWPESGYASLTNTGAVESGAIGTDPTTGKVSIRLTLSQKLTQQIFPSDATNCTVYAVANIDGAGTPGGTSRSALKSTVITAEFGPTTDSDPYAVKQDSFVMDGEGALTRDADNFTITGSVKMYRAASKITFTVSKVSDDDVEDANGDGYKDWAPETDGMRVYYVNGISKGYLNGTMAKADREEGLFSYKTKTVKKGRLLSGDATAGWTHELPFYSYYNYWRSADGSVSGDEGEAPYLLLSMPWKHRTDADPDKFDRYFTCWYAVPFNTVTGHLDRNAWYKVSLSVSILGSGDPDDPTVITPSYMILPWGNETVKTNAELLRYRYLMVDNNEYVMNNVNSLTIPYYTSHKIRVTSSSMTRTVLKPSSGYKPYEEDVDASSYTLTPNADNTGLVFTHDLVNDYSSRYDVTAYTLTFTIQHTDDASFSETITVVQYPALYVVASLNSDCSNPDSGTSGSGNNSYSGYVYVNGNRSDNSRWNGVSYSGGNTDPYMYVVTVSSLPKGSSYIIGDPRTESSTDLSEYNTTRRGNTTYWASEASDMDNTTRRLAYYYPTDEDGTRVNNMIAPSFRIASSYGVVVSLSYDDAKKRCASYQEDGYPAGRWRVPTAAEIEYMVMLANDGKIPVLLSSSSYYWGSNKTAYQPGGDTTTSSRNSHVRCVYDEWYWTDKLSDTQKNTFTWGDKQR